MRAAAGNVVGAKHDLAGQLSLHSQIPLVNVGVPRRGIAQIVRVLIAPVRKLAVLLALRTSKTAGKRVCQSRSRGTGGAAIATDKIVVGKKQVGRLAERGAGVLEVCGRAHSKIDAG